MRTSCGGRRLVGGRRGMLRTGWTASLLGLFASSSLAAQSPYDDYRSTRRVDGPVPALPAPQGPLAENPQAVWSPSGNEPAGSFAPSGSVPAAGIGRNPYGSTTEPVYRSSRPASGTAWGEPGGNATGSYAPGSTAPVVGMASSPIAADPYDAGPYPPGASLPPAWRPPSRTADQRSWSEAMRTSVMSQEGYDSYAAPVDGGDPIFVEAFEPARTPRDRGWQFNRSVLRPDDPVTDFWWDGVGRGYYLNDQRIEFTGLEATFLVEGIVRAGGRRNVGDIQFDFGTELFVTQPFDRNVLLDAQDRIDYAPNFDYPPLEISQMALSGTRGDFAVTIGKFVTPFGRTWFPILSNSRWDTPFIRHEAIGFRETGLLFQYSPGPLRLDAAVTNGSEDGDTNSSKALVARVGWETERFVIGGSVKQQDGIGSEDQKYFNNHVGMDAALFFGRWTFCTELIADEYGFRRAGFGPAGVFWGRNMYHRDRQVGHYDPLTGWGYYGAVGYRGDCWTTWVSYGQFLPDPIGDRIHDTDNHRFMVQGIRSLGQGVDFFGAVMLETTVEQAFAGKDRIGQTVLAGFQFGL